MTAYEDLEVRFKRLGALGEVAGLLQWDTSVMMPSGGAAARGEQLAALDLTCHELIADPALADLLTAAEAEMGESAADLDPWARANLRELRRRLGPTPQFVLTHLDAGEPDLGIENMVFAKDLTHFDF